MVFTTEEEEILKLLAAQAKANALMQIARDETTSDVADYEAKKKALKDYVKASQG